MRHRAKRRWGATAPIAVAVAAALGGVRMAQAQGWQPGMVTTYSQDSWGTIPSPGNAATLLLDNYVVVYGAAFNVVRVGILGAAGFTMSFSSANSVLTYLPAFGTAGPLTSDLVDPTTSMSGVFGGQVLALRLNIDFADAGVTPSAPGIPAFGDITMCNFDTMPLLNGLSVRQFMAVVNTALGGGSALYPIAQLGPVTGGLDRSFGGGAVDPFAHDHLVIGACPPPVAAPLAAAAPHDRRKNRYISFTPNNSTNSVAFRVRWTAAPSGSCWVQAPVATASGVPAQNDQYTAPCGTAPLFRVWNEPVVHVGDCEIIPVFDYEITATANGSVFTAPLLLETIRVPVLNNKLWGDSVGGNNGSEWTPPNQFTNVNDVLALLAIIGGAAIRPHFTVANLQAISAADSCLNAQVNAADVLIAVQAVAGASFGPPSTGKVSNPISCGVCP